MNFDESHTFPPSTTRSSGRNTRTYTLIGDIAENIQNMKPVQYAQTRNLCSTHLHETCAIRTGFIMCTFPVIYILEVC